MGTTPVSAGDPNAPDELTLPDEPCDAMLALRSGARDPPEPVLLLSFRSAASFLSVVESVLSADEKFKL